MNWTIPYAIKTLLPDSAGRYVQVIRWFEVMATDLRQKAAALRREKCKYSRSA